MGVVATSNTVTQELLMPLKNWFGCSCGLLRLPPCFSLFSYRNVCDSWGKSFGKRECQRTFYLLHSLPYNSTLLACFYHQVVNTNDSESPFYERKRNACNSAYSFILLTHVSWYYILQQLCLFAPCTRFHLSGNGESCGNEKYNFFVRQIPQKY